MKILLEGTVTDLGNIKMSDVKEIYIFLRTDKALVARPVLKVKKFLKEEMK